MIEINQFKTEEMKKKITIKSSTIIKLIFYVIGIVSIIIAWKWYNYDLEVFSSDEPFNFYEKTYVGGDAYNYIISASRSTSIMVKSLIWMVFGCSSLIIGLLFPNKTKLCK